MKNVLRMILLLTVMTVSTGIANAGIIITNRGTDVVSSDKQACTDQTEKSVTGIIITNLTGIIITNLTGIIILNATDGGQVNCGIIITN